MLYKLTDSRACTYGDTRWGVGVKNTIPLAFRGDSLCGEGVLHAYKNANLALLLNPLHAAFSNPRLWTAEGEIVVEDWGKCACHELTTVSELSLPDWFKVESRRHAVCTEFAIYCAQEVQMQWLLLNGDEDEYAVIDTVMTAAKSFTALRREGSAWSREATLEAADNAKNLAGFVFAGSRSNSNSNSNKLVLYHAALACASAGGIAASELGNGYYSGAHAASNAARSAAAGGIIIDFCRLADLAATESFFEE